MKKKECAKNLTFDTPSCLFYIRHRSRSPGRGIGMEADDIADYGTCPFKHEGVSKVTHSLFNN